jgi:beta-fructofuranosidase
MEPVQELERLRQDHYHFDNLKITPARDFLPDIYGDALEIKIQMSYDLQTEIGLFLQTSSNGQEQTRVLYQPEHQQLVVQRFNPNPGVDIDSHFVPLVLQSGELLTLHVFLDHSVFEIFVNGHTCLVTRIYPVREKSSQIGLFSGNNPAIVTTLDIWKLKDIWG